MIRKLFTFTLTLSFITIQSAQALSFITLSDPHLNTFLKHHMQIDPNGYDKKNDLDQKTFNSLINLTNNNLGKQGLPKSPDFVLYLGDSVGHGDLISGSRKIFATRSLSAIDHALLKLFPKTPIISVMGNNDSIERDYGHYTFDHTSPFTIAKKAGFKNGFLSTGAYCGKHQFPCLLQENKTFGFFSVKIRSNLILLGLNSVIFSPKNHSYKNAVNAQIKFITDTLKSANENNQGVLIAMHIPVGKSTYSGHAFWRSANTKAFLKLLSKYKNTVRAILVGHTHMDELKIINLDGRLLGEYYTAALSTMHGNSPSLRRYDLAEHKNQWYIKNYETYQIHRVEKSLKLSPYYQFDKKYCANRDIYDINQCLNNISFKDIWPQYTVGNPNYPLAKLKAQKEYRLR